MKERKLVYDYAEGYVIDAETGEVVERIYDCSPPKIARSGAFERRGKRAGKPKAKLRRLVERYRELANYEARGYLVDYEKVFSERMIKSLKHERSAKAERFFAEKGLLDKLASIVEELDARGFTSGMTLRGRLVLAYALYALSRGEIPEYSELGEVVSESTFRRIKSRVEKLHGSWKTGTK
ncbi:MAG: hypothetical protein QXW94_01945 [Desulfurococcaceae archaeon]